MPSGGASALKDNDWNIVKTHYENAHRLGMDYEWLRWFIGGLVIDKMSVADAAFAATVEWDL
jgi:hypothetical protein